jgi:DNA-binding NtrC family response regulator
VLITGFSENDSIISSLRLGAVDYLTQPFTPSDLEKSLRRALDRKKRQDWSRHLYQISEHTDLTLHEKIQKILQLTELSISRLLEAEENALVIANQKNMYPG